MVAAQPEIEQIFTPFEIDPTKYTFTKLLRITAYANRFIRNTNEKARSQHQEETGITAEEINEAALLWIKYVKRKLHYQRTVERKTETKSAQPINLCRWYY